MTDYGTLAATILQKNFDKFGSFRKLCTYTSVGDSVYDPVTGVVVESIASTQPVYIIFDEFSFTTTIAGVMQPDDSSIKEIDKKAIFPSLDLAVTPKVNDKITDDNSVIWRVMGISIDPKPAHYELHVRPISGY